MTVSTNTNNPFRKAERRRTTMKLAFTGPAGSGKTYSALLVAKGLGGRIAVADTENDSASLYSGLPGMPEFDVLTIRPPFLSDKFIAAIRDAKTNGYSTIIIDSISHQWMGEGGILDRKEKEQTAKPQVNSFTLWAKYTPEHERFKQAMAQATINVLATIRSKQGYAIETNEKGKATPKRVGMESVQREGMEYEWTIVFDLSIEHVATVSKDRTSLFDGQFFKPTAETGEAILKWQESGAEPLPEPAPKAPAIVAPRPAAVKPPVAIAPTPPPAIDPEFEKQPSTMAAPIQSPNAPLGMPDLVELKRAGEANSWTPADLGFFLTNKYRASKLKDLNRKQFEEFLTTVKNSGPVQARALLSPPPEEQNEFEGPEAS